MWGPEAAAQAKVIPAAASDLVLLAARLVLTLQPLQRVEEAEELGVVLVERALVLAQELVATEGLLVQVTAAAVAALAVIPAMVARVGRRLRRALLVLVAEVEAVAVVNTQIRRALGAAVAAVWGY